MKLRQFELAFPIMILMTACGIKPDTQRYQNLIYNSGYISNLDSILIKGQSEFDIYDIQSGQNIADIGCGNGWFEGYLLLAFDSLNIYAQDINKSAIRNMHHAIDKYISLDSSKTDNQIHFVIGNKTATNLPDYYFDKIIIRETFHHFSNRDEMLQDIYSKLRSNGRVYVYEPSVSATIYSQACGAFLLDKPTILDYFERNNFNIETEIECTGNPGNVPPWHDVPEAELEEKIVLIFKKN